MNPSEAPEKSKGKDTVRQRKKSEAAAVQHFLPIAEIKQDTVVLKNGGLRAVLEVTSMNFSLKSEEEQEAIITSYQQFLNTLDFPLQICIHSSKLNVDVYLNDLRERVKRQENPLLREQTLDYIQFIDRLITVSDIMQKEFYAVVPADPPGSMKISFFQKYLGWFSPGDTREKAIGRQNRWEDMSVTLKDRVNVVEGGLANIGLPARRLSTAELIALFYQIYNPETSGTQKLPLFSALNLKEYVL